MKKCLILVTLCLLLLVGCSEISSTEDTQDVGNSEENNSFDTYSIGDEVLLCGVKFNVYKIGDDNELYLLAKNSIATTQFSDSEHSGDDAHDYEGSLVQGYVDRFVDGFEDKGININMSGIIDEEDLYELGFKHSDTLSGLPYKDDEVQEFVKSEESYWVGGYCKYDTYSWVYTEGILDTQPCENEYGVKPIIVVEMSEIEKQLQEIDTNLTIKEIVKFDCAWECEGGISNPNDRYYFDCDNMIFKNVFESSEFSNTYEYNMEFIDDKTIKVDGVRAGEMIPAEITIVNENKLRIRFIDDYYNDGDYYLNKMSE